MAGLVLRQLDQIAEAELGIPSGGLAPAARPLVEMLEEDAQERSLELGKIGRASCRERVSECV